MPVSVTMIPLEVVQAYERNPSPWLIVAGWKLISSAQAEAEARRRTPPARADRFTELIVSPFVAPGQPITTPLMYTFLGRSARKK